VTPEVIGNFVKSSYSGQNNNCIEIAATTEGGRAVRDSKDKRGPHLTFTGGAWQAFLRGVKWQEFDR
jgi:Domain of unknown function (DUF397)